MSNSTRVHSSAISSKEFKKLLKRFGITYGMYPSFIVVTPFRDYISNWGELSLSEIPRKPKLDQLDKYFLLIGLGLHAIAPKNEFNRLALRMIASKKFDIDWKSPQISSLSGVFSTLYIYTKLMNNPLWREIAEKPLKSITKNLETIAKHPLLRLVVNYYRMLLNEDIDFDLEDILREMQEIFLSPTSLTKKAEEFFDIIYQLIKNDVDRKNTLNSLTRSFALSIGGPAGENKSKLWGRNWRTEKNKDPQGITPEELAELAKINEKAAMEIAKELDKKQEEESESLGKTEEQKEGFLPGYSDRLKMLQKLLAQRRYLAAIRKIRINEILSAVRERPTGPSQLAMRGHTVWELGDREEELNIEMSLETYGFLIPNKTTLKSLYEEDPNGTKRQGVGHIEIVIDTSGSMNGPPLETAIDVAVALTESAKRREDSIALVTFSSGAWEGLPPSYDYDYIIDILLRLIADGGTNLRGALKVVEDHLNSTSENSAIFIITDSAVWDISRSEVREKLLNWSYRHTLYMIVTADELYDETEYSLRGSGIRLIKVSPWKEGNWEIVLSEYEKL
ncbi:MAG: VWA domain-containing protein [Candidatus Njordarchaeia archaeon]